MKLIWSEWRSKLVAVGYPNAASLDEQTLMKLMFRPSAQRKKLISWISRKIVEMTGIRETSILSIFSSFVFGGKDTLTSFIEGTNSKNVMENIWNSILNDLRPMSPICGDEESLNAFLLSNTKMVTLEQFGFLEMESLPPAETPHQPDILDRVDENINRAEAVLAKYAAAITSPSIPPRLPGKLIRSLAQLNEDAGKLNQHIKGEKSVENLVKQIDPAMAPMRVTADLDEFVAEIKTMDLALKNLESVRTGKSIVPSDYQ